MVEWIRASKPIYHYELRYVTARKFFGKCRWIGAFCGVN